MKPPRQGPPGWVVALVAVAVVCLVAAVGGATWLVISDERDTTADPGRTPAASSTPPATTAPATTAPPTTAPPTTAPPAKPGQGSRLTTDDFGWEDWDFQLGESKASARLVGERNLASCAPVDRRGRIAKLGCAYALQWTYRSLGDKLWLTQVVLAFDSDAAATRAAKELRSKPDLLAPPPGSQPKSPYDGWSLSSDATGKLVVVSFGFPSAKVPEKEARRVLGLFNVDHASALLFMDL